jgi:hypothetical protein
VVMMMYKYIFDPDLVKKLPGIFSLMWELMEKETGLQHLEAVLRYLFNTVDHISTDDIKTIVAKSLSDREGDYIMTLAEKLKKEGFEKGVEQGMRQGMRQGMQQGMLEGLLEGIEMAVSLKFPEEAYKIMPLIYQINTISQLKIVKDAIMAVRSASELMTMITGSR